MGVEGRISPFPGHARAVWPPLAVPVAAIALIADVPAGDHPGRDRQRLPRPSRGSPSPRRHRVRDARRPAQPAVDRRGRRGGHRWPTGDLIEAPYLCEQGHTGAGVGTALVNSGTMPVEGLTTNVFHGPDLSYEAADPALRYLDTYGHGTHLAGIAAGRDRDRSLVDTDGDGDAGDAPYFGGVAPDATLISVTVAVANGFADVSQVIAAIDWVVQHRVDHNIRVLCLAFGADGVQDCRLDPLPHAVEVAWRKGIVVVTAAGNTGYGDGRMDNPAYDPFVIAVGANDPTGTKPTHDDLIPAWSSRGDGRRNPDMVAPGASIVSLRDPGSRIDRRHADARVGDRFLRDSGTSQAAAVVAGSAALLIDGRPELSPDQVKDLLRSTASPVPDADAATWIVAATDGVTWSGGGWSGRYWADGDWNSGSWSGNGWSHGHWSGVRTGNSWSGEGWTGNSWSDEAWSAAMWQ